MTEILIALISSAFTFLATKYTTSYPRIKAINETQFYKVYLPIIKELKFSPIVFDEKSNSDDFVRFYKLVEDIIKIHYEYVNPEFIELFDQFKYHLHISDFEKSKQAYTNLIDYTNYNYDVIKRKLHLPNKSFFNEYIRSEHTVYFTRVYILLSITSLIFAIKIVILRYFQFEIPKRPYLIGIRDNLEIAFNMSFFVIFSCSVYNIALCLFSFFKYKNKQRYKNKN